MWMHNCHEKGNGKNSDSRVRQPDEWCTLDLILLASQRRSLKQAKCTALWGRWWRENMICTLVPRNLTYYDEERKVAFVFYVGGPSHPVVHWLFCKKELSAAFQCMRSREKSKGNDFTPRTHETEWCNMTLLNLWTFRFVVAARSLIGWEWDLWLRDGRERIDL